MKFAVVLLMPKEVQHENFDAIAQLLPEDSWLYADDGRGGGR